MTREQLIDEARRLRAGIRTHRDSTGHALCWHHPQLWSLLPERTDPLPTVPTWPEFLRGLPELSRISGRADASCAPFRGTVSAVRRTPHADHSRGLCHTRWRFGPPSFWCSCRLPLALSPPDGRRRARAAAGRGNGVPDRIPEPGPATQGLHGGASAGSARTRIRGRAKPRLGAAVDRRQPRPATPARGRAGATQGRSHPGPRVVRRDGRQAASTHARSVSSSSRCTPR